MTMMMTNEIRPLVCFGRNICFCALFCVCDSQSVYPPAALSFQQAFVVHGSRAGALPQPPTVYSPTYFLPIIWTSIIRKLAEMPPDEDDDEDNPPAPGPDRDACLGREELMVITEEAIVMHRQLPQDVMEFLRSTSNGAMQLTRHPINPRGHDQVLQAHSNINTVARTLPGGLPRYYNFVLLFLGTVWGWGCKQ